MEDGTGGCGEQVKEDVTTGEIWEVDGAAGPCRE